MSVSSSLDTSWAIQSDVSSDLGASWLIGVATSDLSTSWAITSYVSSDLETSWLIGVATGDLPTSWLVGISNSSLSPSWQIAGSLSVDKEIGWSIDSSVQQIEGFWDGAYIIKDPKQGEVSITGSFAGFTPNYDWSMSPTVAVSESLGQSGATEITLNNPAFGTSLLGTLYAFLSFDALNGSITGFTPDNTGLTAEWSLDKLVIQGNGDNGLAIFSKEAWWRDDPATFLFTRDGTGTPDIAGAVVFVHNPDGQLGTNPWQSDATEASGLSHSTGSLTSPSAPAVLLYAVGGSRATTFSSAGMTEVTDTSAPSWASLSVAIEQVANAGAVDPRVTTSAASVASVRAWQWLEPEAPASTGYMGWVRMDLSAPATLWLNTYGSTTPDTKLAVFDYQPVLGGPWNPIYENDDTYEDVPPEDWYHSSIPREGSGNWITLPVGTYYITTWPYSGSSWTPDGNITLAIKRLDAPPVPVAFKILVDGLDITYSCDIARTSFEMHAGPLPGTAKVYVLDTDHTRSIATGSEITLDIEEFRQWGGYVTSITSEFAFPVDDTSDPAATPRYFVLNCSDYNILFSKRFIRNKADSTKRVPKYAVGTKDSQIVIDMFNKYLDVDDDGLTYNRVQHVGTPQEDGSGSPAVAGMSWGTAMKNTALLPGAIYYIDAAKDLSYADVDVFDAPFSLSDVPDGVSSFGYRQMSITEDGTMLANDAFVWGTGLGQNKMTFKNYENSDSQGEHGLWQWADYRQDLYRPQSVLKRATTYVEGSTQNNRGHKDPAVTIRCTIFKPGLRAGMKTRFICSVHDFDDVIPIRSLRVKFINNTEAVYELVLAHYLDEAWNTAEFPPLEGPHLTRHCETLTVTDGKVTTTYPYIESTVTVYSQDGEEITWEEDADDDSGKSVFVQPVETRTAYWKDDFLRIEENGWGNGWYTWPDNSGPRGGSPWVTVSAGKGHFYWPIGSTAEFTAHRFVEEVAGPKWVATIKFRFTHMPTSEWEAFNYYMHPQLQITFRPGVLRSPNFGQVTISPISGPPVQAVPQSEIRCHGSPPYFINPSFWQSNSDYYFSVLNDRTNNLSGAKVWRVGTDEPDWMAVRHAIPEEDLEELTLGDLRRFVIGSSFGDAEFTSTEILSFDWVSFGPPLEEVVIVCYGVQGNIEFEPPGGYGGGPVYRPHHVHQLGWGSILDGENCTMASACIALDRHTEGAKTANPPEMRMHQNDQTGGTDLNDAAVAWASGFGESLNVEWNTSWASFVSMVNGGRGAILQGTYSLITDEYSSQTSFDGGHAMYINEFNETGYALVYDPLAAGSRWMPADMLRDYAEDFGGGSCNAAYTKVTN